MVRDGVGGCLAASSTPPHGLPTAVSHHQTHIYHGQTFTFDDDLQELSSLSDDGMLETEDDDDFGDLHALVLQETTSTGIDIPTHLPVAQTCPYAKLDLMHCCLVSPAAAAQHMQCLCTSLVSLKCYYSH